MDCRANNLINDASLDGIFCDDRAGSLPTTSMLFANNMINRTGRDGIRLYTLIVNNAIAQVNTQGGRVFTFMQGAGNADDKRYGSDYDVGAYKYTPASSAGAHQAALVLEMVTASRDVLIYPSPAHSHIFCQQRQ